MSAQSRRTFLRSGLKLSGLLIAVSSAPTRLLAEQAQEQISAGQIGAVLRFDEQGLATLLVPTPDMGQGMMTTSAQILADELDLDLDRVQVQLNSAIERYDAQGQATSGEFVQGAGGSLSTMVSWPQLRRAAAYARALLVSAAAAHWNAPQSQLETRAGRVHHRGNGASIGYAELVAAASQEHSTLRPNNVEPKRLAQLTRVGRDQRNVHARQIATGQPLFAGDLSVPGMLHAVIRRCPHLNGSVQSFDASAAEAMPGVVRVLPFPRVPEDRKQWRQRAAGIAVVAKSHWQALKAAQALSIDWDGSLAVEDDSVILHTKCMKALSDGEFQQLHQHGDVEAALAASAHQVDLSYYHPHWAHTCMEPHNAIADVRADSAEIWVGNQNALGVVNAVAEATGLRANQVKVNIQRMGTGFGRKWPTDYVTEAALISQQVGAPVKLQWTREDEIEQDYYNPLGAYRIRAGVDSDGNLSAWHFRVASDALLRTAAQDLPIGLVPASLGESLQIPNNISRGAWRGPQHNVAGWVIQSTLDELAEQAGIDSLQFLLRLYSGKAPLRSPNWPFVDIDTARHVALLEKVAAEADWGKSLPAGRGQGIAVHQTFHSIAAHVVEVEMRGERDFIVHRVTSAIDCGLVINPLGVRAQVEGGVIDGICAAKYGEVRFDKGVPVSNNFNSYRKLRYAEAPRRIDVHLMDHGDSEPRGTGETALPPVIPALTNAIYAASGKRVRRLPLLRAEG